VLRVLLSIGGLPCRAQAAALLRRRTTLKILFFEVDPAWEAADGRLEPLEVTLVVSEGSGAQGGSGAASVECGGGGRWRLLMPAMAVCVLHASSVRSIFGAGRQATGGRARTSRDTLRLTAGAGAVSAGDHGGSGGHSLLEAGPEGKATLTLYSPSTGDHGGSGAVSGGWLDCTLAAEIFAEGKQSPSRKDRRSTTAAERFRGPLEDNSSLGESSIGDHGGSGCLEETASLGKSSIGDHGGSGENA